MTWPAGHTFTAWLEVDHNIHKLITTGNTQQSIVYEEFRSVQIPYNKQAWYITLF
jgi:hypothetical protein